MSVLANYPTPTTCKEVKGFLGTSLASFSSVLLQDTKHLRALTKKGTAFTWGDEEEGEMQTIIKRLTDPTILHHYDTSLPLAIDVDTSAQGVGYVAYMFDPSKGPPGPNNAKLVKCGSASSKPSWANYSPIELEATGSLLAVRKLDIVNNKQVEVHNDHLPFIQSFNSKDISQVSPRLRRIFLELAEQLKDAWPNIHVVENSKHQKLFVFEGTKFLVPPGAIKEVHEVVDICHMGYIKAIRYARARYFWPRMAQSIEAHCNACLICIQHSASKPAEEILPPAKFNTPTIPLLRRILISSQKLPDDM